MTLWENSPIVDLIREGDAVVGAVIKHKGVPRCVFTPARASCLQPADFAANKALRQKHYTTTKETMTLVPEGNTGRRHDAWSSALAPQSRKATPTTRVWITVSRYKEKDGTIIPIPHILDFGRPGIIVVNKDGKRFANEATLFVGSKMNEMGFVARLGDPR